MVLTVDNSTSDLGDLVYHINLFHDDQESDNQAD